MSHVENLVATSTPLKLVYLGPDGLIQTPSGFLVTSELMGPSRLAAGESHSELPLAKQCIHDIVLVDMIERIGGDDVGYCQLSIVARFVNDSISQGRAMVHPLQSIASHSNRSYTRSAPWSAFFGIGRKMIFQPSYSKCQRRIASWPPDSYIRASSSGSSPSSTLIQK